MNREILLFAEQLKDVYNGEPWFGRSVHDILKETDEAIVFEKPGTVQLGPREFQLESCVHPPDPIASCTAKISTPVVFLKRPAHLPA